MDCYDACPHGECDECGNNPEKMSLDILVATEANQRAFEDFWAAIPQGTQTNHSDYKWLAMHAFMGGIAATKQHKEISEIHRLLSSPDRVEDIVEGDTLTVKMAKNLIHLLHSYGAYKDNDECLNCESCTDINRQKSKTEVTQ